MKNKKAIKLTLLALSLVLIIGIGAAVGIFASAEGEELSVEINARNISYGDVIKVLFAVDDTNAGGKDVEILYYLDDPQSNPDAKAYKGTPYEKGYTEDGVTYPAFFTAAFPAKDIASQVYAQAHIVDTDVYSEIVRYSVVEYLNKRLYVDDISDNQKGLYESLLTYGAFAQKVLLNEDDDPYNDVTQFVDEMVYVSIEGGTLDGKYSTGVYYPGDKIIPHTDGAVAWNVNYTDKDGNTGFASVGNGTEYSVMGTSFITLNTSAALKSYFDHYMGTNADGWDFDNDTFTSTEVMETSHILKRATRQTAHIAADRLDYNPEYIRIQPLEDGNKVFEFGVGPGSTQQGFFFRRHSTESNGYYAGQFVFETKINLNVADAGAQAVLDSGSNYIMNISLSNSSAYMPDQSSIRSDFVTGTEVGRIYVTKDEAGKFHYYYNYATENTDAVATSLSELKNGWNTITTEMTLTQLGTCTGQYYVNGCKVGESSFDGTTDAALLAAGVDRGLAKPNGVRITFDDALKSTRVFMDNIFCSYAAQPTAD